MRFAVLRTGMDGDGAYAVVSVGSHPNATTVRLRVGVPHTLPDGRLLHLFALAPVGSRPAVAFEITTAGEAGVGQAGIAGEQVASLTISPWSGGELEVEGPAGTVVEVPDWGTVTIVEPEAGEDGDGPRAPLRIQTLTDFPVVDESQV